MVLCVSSPRSRRFRGSRWELSRPCPSSPSPAASPTTTHRPPTSFRTRRGCWPGAGARFVNELRAFIEVEDGRIIAHGHLGGGHIGSTTLRLAATALTFPGAAFPDLRPQPQSGDGWVRFEQTTGGRTGVAAPHLVRRRPFVQLAAPTVWTTLALTIHADGRSDYQMIGASPFPRHWIYDHTGHLAEIGRAS